MARDTLPQGPHLTDEVLAQVFESELFGLGQESRAGSDRERRHLAQCPACRNRFDQMRNAVAAFVEDRNYRYDPTLQPPPGRWAGFYAKIQPEIRPNRVEPQTGARRRSRTPVWRWAAGIAASIGLITILFIQPEKAVSASEALGRGATEESQAGGVPRPLIYRKLRIESAAGTAECELWSAPRERRSLDRWSGRPSVQTGLLSVYRQNRLSIDSSLSPSGYQQWRRANLPAKDQVMVDPAHGLVTVSTTRLGEVQNGDIVQSTLIMRRSNWHTIGQGFRVRVGQGYVEYWLRELDYRAIAYSEAAWAQVAGSRAAAPEGHEPKLPEAAEAPRQRIDEIATELRVLDALNRAGLDTTADVEIRPDPGALRLLAYGSPADERARIASAVDGIPGVRLQFPRASRNAAQTEQVYRGSASSVPPLMLKQLVLAAGSEQAAAERIAQVNAAFADGRAHALALNRLSQRNLQIGQAWTERPDLSPTAEDLARRHAGRIAKRMSEIRELLRPVLNAPASKKSMDSCRLWTGGLSSLPEEIAGAQRVSDRLFSVTSSDDFHPDAGDLSQRLDKIWKKSEECSQ